MHNTRLNKPLLCHKELYNTLSKFQRFEFYVQEKTARFWCTEATRTIHIMSLQRVTNDGCVHQNGRRTAKLVSLPIIWGKLLRLQLKNTTIQLQIITLVRMANYTGCESNRYSSLILECHRYDGHASKLVLNVAKWWCQKYITTNGYL